jgi:hypothetical protein
MKKQVKINTRIDGPITKEDYHRQATVADLKASRLLTEKNLNNILLAFSQQRTQFETRFNVLWNIMSAIIQFLDEKDIITLSDFARIGMELQALHRRNMDAIRKATSEKRRVEHSEIAKPPIDRLLEAMGNTPAKPTLVRADAGCEDSPLPSQTPTDPAPPPDGFNCGNCGEEVRPEDEKCPKCGVEFDEETPDAG